MQKDAIAFLDGKAGLTGAKMNKTEAGMRLSEYEVAEDMLIDGLKIVQDTRLYRFTSDSVLLSRFARAKAGDKVADFCAGSGIVAFHFYALHRALKGLDFTLFEMQRQLSELSVKTAALNGFGNFEAVNCKIQEMPETYRNFPSCCATRPTSGAGLKTTIIKKRSAARRLQSILRRLQGPRRLL